MITLQITDNSPEAMKFLEHALSLPYIRETKTRRTSSEQRIPGLAYTREERIASVIEGMEDIRVGRKVSNDEMGRWINGLR